MAPATCPAVAKCLAIRPATYSPALKEDPGAFLEDGRAAAEGGREGGAALGTGILGGNDPRLATFPRDGVLGAGGLALRAPSGAEIFGGGGGLALGGAPGARPEGAVGAAPSAAGGAPEVVRPSEADGGPPERTNKRWIGGPYGREGKGFFPVGKTDKDPGRNTTVF